MVSRRNMLALLLGLGLVTGCTYLRQLVGWVADKPQVKVLDVEVQSFQPQRIDLVFVLDIYNPNSFAIDIDRLDYHVLGLGIPLGKGSLIEPVVLKGEAHHQVRLPFAVDPEAGRQIFKKYLANPRELKIKLFAHIFLNTAFGKMDTQFEEDRNLMKGLMGP